MGVEFKSSSRKGTTPGASLQTHRPTPPKRAHTSAASVTTIGSAAKKNATAANTDADRKIKTPLLTPQIQRAQQSTNNHPRTPSPNYFGLVVEEDAANYGIDSGAGKHAKQNWNYEERELPVEDDPRFANFRQHSEHGKSFRLANSLSRYGTDSRVPTLRAMNENNMSDSSPDRQPLSAGGRLTSHVVESSEDDEMDVDNSEQENGTSGHLIGDEPSFFSMQISASPVPGPETRPRLQHAFSSSASRHAPGSLPQSRVTTPLAGAAMKPRAGTLPAQMDADSPKLISVKELSDILSANGTDALLLDLRVSPQYAASRVKGALNLCIPTTLLKRPAFNVQKLADTFNSPTEKTKFARWRQASHIIVYDAASIQLKDALSCINTLKKFRSEGYEGIISIIKGGYNAVSRQRQDLVEKPDSTPSSTQNGMKLTIDAKVGQTRGGPGIQVAGGCQMPSEDQQPANPFFGNIRQNMDLIDGVGQMAIKRPASLTDRNLQGLPAWLRDVVDEENEGKTVSERFLKLERAEQKRMQHALSTKVHYGTPMPSSQIASEAQRGNAQIAGIEKGAKNRYKDMLPFEHTRVRLRETKGDGCDYINASHIRPHGTNRSYIASQAPVPTTFGDFWRLIWEQDVRVVVMLTGEFENGQRKCHPYWQPDTYGDFKVKQLSEKRVSLESPPPPSLLEPSRKASMPISQLHTQRSIQRRATLAFNPEDTERPTLPDSEKEPPSCVVRKLAVSNIQQPFAPLREIAQIMYTSWPDFGAPAEAGELLALVEEVGKSVRNSNNAGHGPRSEEGASSGLRRPGASAVKIPVEDGERPIVVHCSAGCGRTGTFVTVDTVCDMLRRQRAVATSQRQKQGISSDRGLGVPGSGREDDEVDPFELGSAQQARVELDSSDSDAPSQEHGDGMGELNKQDWVTRDDIDLVEKTVTELRSQRISMVQNLRQFTLCYESVLEWLVREMPERFRRDNFRKSYQG